MTTENLDIIVAGTVGGLAIVGIIILAALGKDSTTLDTLAGLFASGAFGGGLYKIVTKKPGDGTNGKS